MNEHPGINCMCQDCEEAKRRFRYARRKMEAEDRERNHILGTVRAQRDNDFLQSCGIAPVTFEGSRITLSDMERIALCQKT